MLLKELGLSQEWKMKITREGILFYWPHPGGRGKKHLNSNRTKKNGSRGREMKKPCGDLSLAYCPNDYLHHDG